MIPRERVIQALKHKETPIIPYNIFIDEAVVHRLDEHYGGRDKWPKYEDHMVRILWEVLRKDKGNGFYEDIFGVTWKKTDTINVSIPLLDEPDVSQIHWPELITDDDVNRIIEICKNNKNKFIYYQFTSTFGERGWALRGLENWLADLVLNQSFVEELLDILLTLHLKAIDKIAHLPIDGIILGDDYGMQKGLMMSPDVWRRFFKKRLKIIFEKVRKEGKIVGLHSCGDNTEIMADLVDIGLQIFHPLQQESMDIENIKRDYGRYLTFRGGIGTQRFVGFGKPSEIINEMKRCVWILSRGGGYILETCKPLMFDVPIENAVTVLETIIKLSKKEL